MRIIVFDSRVLLYSIETNVHVMRIIVFDSRILLNSIEKHVHVMRISVSDSQFSLSDSNETYIQLRDFFFNASPVESL